MTWRKSRKIKNMAKGPTKQDRALEQRRRRAQLKQQLIKGEETKRERPFERFDLWNHD